MRRSTARLTVVLAVGLALTACTAGGGDAPEDEGTEPSVTSEEAEAAKGAAEDLAAAAGDDVEPIAIDKELPVLATRPTTAGDIALEIDLNGVTVSGEVMTVLFTARNLGEERWQVSDYFDDGSSRAPLVDGEEAEESDGRLAFTTDGVTVIDTANGLMHRTAYDTQGGCACSSNLVGTFVDQGAALVLTTSFAAPADDVETVTVTIPGAGSFDDVPVTR